MVTLNMAPFYASTNTCKFRFLPRTVELWNILPGHIRSVLLNEFLLAINTFFVCFFSLVLFFFSYFLCSVSFPPCLRFYSLYIFSLMFFTSQHITPHAFVQASPTPAVALITGCSTYAQINDQNQNFIHSFHVTSPQPFLKYYSPFRYSSR